MNILLTHSGCQVTCDSLSELDDACEALARAVACVAALAPAGPPPAAKARPTLNDKGAACVAWLRANPVNTYASCMAAGHEKSTIKWLTKHGYVSWDASIQLLTALPPHRNT